MEQSRLDRQLQAYAKWKSVLIKTMDDYRGWMRRYRLLTEQGARRIDECRDTLANDRLTIAFVAEFSRGKTELINAIFFADYGRRLLPSTAGRTTMCPTEMFWDEQAGQAYVRLLPIETRLQEQSLETLKKQPESWVSYPLDLDSADQIERCLREVIETRRVSLAEAVRLGLYDPEQHPHRDTPPQQVEIPKWRHALISFPHPLLQRGLTILDTPGLNALGSEPELTLNMLPSAQAVLFVLAADTGVTRTDLEMWQNHIKGYQHRRQQGLVVVLNKVDTLWDDLRDQAAIDAAIERQCTSTAQILSLPRSAIFPVSAQKALLAKVKEDDQLLQRSTLPDLEAYLSRNILDARREIIQDTLSAEISHMLESTIGIVANKQRSIGQQLEELQGLSGKSREVIEHLMARTRTEQANYIQDVNSFQASRQVLKQQAVKLRHALDLHQLELLIDQTEQRMKSNWTTHGLKKNMQGLFGQMREQMQQVVEQSEASRKLIRSIYRRFQSDHNFAVIQPRMFSIMRYRVELDMLYQEAEIFRNSPVMAMTEQHFVIRRFFVTLVGRARMIFTTARREVDNWLKTVLDPLGFQIKEHRAQMESRLRELQKISHSRDTLGTRIDELNRQEQAARRQLLILQNMYRRLNDRQPLADDTPTRPRLVRSRSA